MVYYKQQTNALLSIKMPTMSSIINKKSQYTIDSHNMFSLDMTIQKKYKKKIKKITFSKKYCYNGCIFTKLNAVFIL